VTTDGAARRDVDPVQLRWAGLPRSGAFDPVDLRREQREYLNVLCQHDGDAWRLVTFQDRVSPAPSSRATSATARGFG
jgi:hypothetical protein